MVVFGCFVTTECEIVVDVASKSRSSVLLELEGWTWTLLMGEEPVQPIDVTNC